MYSFLTKAGDNGAEVFDDVEHASTSGASAEPNVGKQEIKATQPHSANGIQHRMSGQPVPNIDRFSWWVRFLIDLEVYLVYTTI
ncbi:hypothetical protein I7I50_08903 [Histoplasma capsulatum G186AR]|uniref:Uncharacterized protein n=1 Tax=Ajellomyces capsulatus TaxID=5037 RepID=A0A8H7YUP9_AJECA|nr:hypothetical protein I7I52_06419 [Histoplasma capsulatum]QSS73947.1 hypothetical protein I7I50_08903 [Histoplasma capsulatum G186AR]